MCTCNAHKLIPLHTVEPERSLERAQNPQKGSGPTALHIDKILLLHSSSKAVTDAAKLG